LAFFDKHLDLFSKTVQDMAIVTVRIRMRSNLSRSRYYSPNVK